MSWDYVEYCSEETEVIFESEEVESSEDPPIHEWSSLLFDFPEDNEKKILHGQGLYDPGSGEVCAKYIGISDSSLLQHLYHNYPAVEDPGILDAFYLPENPIIYPEDGQQLYIATCEEMSLAPISSFHRDLIKEEIDLSYYCVNPKGVRAMAMALTDNTEVKKLNLTDNFLTDDACYHLGEMLMINTSLREINLSGCKIKSTGVKRLLKGLARNNYLNILNLNKNDIGDKGAEHVAMAVTQGLQIKELYLSYNNISASGVSALAETRPQFVKLDLSWNTFIAPEPTYCLLAKLGESDSIEEIDLSWNALAGPLIGKAIKLLMKAPNLRYLNLSNNALAGEALVNLIGNLGKAQNLVTLDLSYNPLTPSDALSVLTKMKSPAVQVQNILLENVFIDFKFLDLLREVKEMDTRKKFNVIYGGVISSFKGIGPDMRELVLKRVEYLSKRSKKNKGVHIALIVLQRLKENVHIMTGKDFAAMIRASSISLDANLLDTIIDVFGAPGTPKNKKVNMVMLADYVERLWPDKKLPPTPPPEPEPLPAPEVPTVRNRKDKIKKKAPTKKGRQF